MSRGAVNLYVFRQVEVELHHNSLAFVMGICLPVIEDGIGVNAMYFKRLLDYYRAPYRNNAMFGLVLLTGNTLTSETNLINL